MLSRPLAALPLVALLVAGCERRPDDVPVVVSAIGDPARLVDPITRSPSPASAALIGATAQGLVRFDANGQVEPALAERWIVIDDGRSYIFRLSNAKWSDGSAVTASQVVRRLRSAIAASADHPIAPFLRAIDEVVEMTPEVIEVRLSRPRPDLLALFAHPALAIASLPDRIGSGPMRIVSRSPAEGFLLAPAEDMAVLSEEPEDPAPEEFVRLRGERAATAILRFARRESDLVLGGRFTDWPLLEQADLPPNALRIDPAVGLFGFAIVERNGFLAEAANRAAIAMSIDRAALTLAFRPEWAAVETILPAQLDSISLPAAPDWSTLPLTQRRAIALSRVATWRGANPISAPIRVALPEGPGSNLVWGQVAQAMAAIGLPARRVDLRDDADLRLIDAVAPYDNGRWYLFTACRLCSGATIERINAVRDAPDIASRAARLAEADLAVAADVPFIPLAQPLRWSLVAQRLGQFQTNARARHPLNRLRPEAN